MIPLLADEDLNGRLVRGLLRHKSDLDLVRVQDVGLGAAGDDRVLDWADRNGRLLLTHDSRTMPGHIRSRLAGGAHVAGVFIVDDRASIGDCIADILLVAECSEVEEWRDRIVYVPFR